MNTLRYNGCEVELSEGITLAALLTAQGAGSTAIATAVNGQFVAREKRDQTRLHAGDDVITFQAIVGG
jgi:sulfur carrier protein